MVFLSQMMGQPEAKFNGIICVLSIMTISVMEDLIFKRHHQY